MSRRWTFSQILVLISLVLDVLAFFAALGWLGLTHWTAWVTAAFGVYVASFLPWRTSP